MSSSHCKLLQKSSFIPRVICLYPDKDQQSEIQSDDSSSHKNHSISKQITNHSSHLDNLRCAGHQQKANNSVQPIPHHFKKSSKNLLQPPNKDYAEKSQIYIEKRIEQIATKNYEKESYFGRRKSKVIEISDVSSQSEADSLKEVNKNPSKQRKLNEWEEEDQLLQKYSIGGFQPQNSKKKQIIVDEEKQQNPFAHLHPDFDQQKKGPPSDHQSGNLSEINSDDSLIIIRPKHKHTHKRLRKMAVTNRVKIENKQNGGETQDCPICLTDLNKKDEKKKGKLACNHLFCLKCITESSKFSNRCPYCRATFNQITCKGRRIEVEDTRLNQEYEDPNEQPCYICGRNNDFEHLLECEFCEYAYCHTYCDPRLNNRELGAEEPWYCASCEQLMRHRLQNGEQEGEEGGQDEQSDQVVEDIRPVRQPRQPQNRRNESDKQYEASDEQEV